MSGHFSSGVKWLNTQQDSEQHEGGPRIGGFCPQSFVLFESAGNSGNTGQKPPIRGPPSYFNRVCLARQT